MTLEQLKREAAAVKAKLADDNASQTAEHMEQQKMLEVSLTNFSREVIAGIPNAIIQAEARGLKRAIIGRIKDDMCQDNWPKRDPATAVQPLQTEYIPPLIRAGLPAGVQLRMEHAMILQGQEHDKEGPMQVRLMNESIVDVYIPRLVPKTAQARPSEWDGRILMIEWE